MSGQKRKGVYLWCWRMRDLEDIRTENRVLESHAVGILERVVREGKMALTREAVCVARAEYGVVGIHFWPFLLC
jgi:hypothetical protein